jgi:uncharacterized RDD family membrane protein YckC
MNETGLGVRVVNFLVDTLLIFLLAYGLYKWYTFYVIYWKYTYFPFYQFFFSTLFLYYSIFEMIWGRTPGKWVSISKVQSKNGKRAAWYQVLLRSLLRLTIIDLFFIPFFNRTLHDQLSNTRVVEA